MSKRERSRHQLKVATSGCTEKKTATTFSCRDINCEDLRSRHHQAVAKTGARKSGRDIIQMSRHPLQRLEGRDNI